MRLHFRERWEFGQLEPTVAFAQIDSDLTRLLENAKDLQKFDEAYEGLKNFTSCEQPDPFLVLIDENPYLLHAKKRSGGWFLSVEAL